MATRKIYYVKQNEKKLLTADLTLILSKTKADLEAAYRKYQSLDGDDYHLTLQETMAKLGFTTEDALECSKDMTEFALRNLRNKV